MAEKWRQKNHSARMVPSEERNRGRGREGFNNKATKETKTEADQKKAEAVTNSTTDGHG